MIKIENSKGPFVTKNVIFEKSQPSGRKTTNYIEATRTFEDMGETVPATINIPLTGNMVLEDVPEFIKAVELAAMIASGKLETD